MHKIPTEPSPLKKEYKVPEDYYIRLHHVRPRFKDNLDDVLIYCADAISSIPRDDKEVFAQKVNSLLRQFPGNITKADKTINNWRTEISALFGFIESDDSDSWAGLRAKELAEQQDLIAFFKTFLYSFQYPGAHLKDHYIKELIENGVRFKPAQYILNMLYWKFQQGDTEYLTKAETCHCIFNDLRCVRDNEAPELVWDRIIANRRKGLGYDEEGDVIRYAGDIIDYMEQANLLKTYDFSKYYLNTSDMDVILRFVNSTEYFTGYDSFIRCRTVSYDEINSQKNEWFAWVNREMDTSDFSTDITDIIPTDVYTPTEIQSLVDVITEDDTEATTSSTGLAGEALVYGHECQTLVNGCRPDLVHLVKQIPTHLAMGYDIKSLTLQEEHKYIEVKTTISARPLQFKRFHLTPNEWRSAESNREMYYVYRLMISRNERKLYILRNPVKLYKEDKIVGIPSNGMDIIFDDNVAGHYEELLTWEGD